jgi:hypothetical protein
VLVNNSTNINKTKKVVDQHCLHFLCFADIGGIIDQHCLHFLCFGDIGGIDSAGQQLHQ